MLANTNYNPDVLNCLANLSNDEVFTPPSVANQMLDLLPEEIWKDDTATFLDPVSKSGVFLREIVKRLNIGLVQKFPKQDDRLNHIFKNQVFGIAITELTALLSRRSVYCSKHANGKYSIYKHFDDKAGNIIFNDVNHKWDGKKCEFCKVSMASDNSEENKETHAYEFIHTENPKDLFNMKFDVIIGNPPYQLNDYGSGASASPIYQYFIEQAKKLQPQHLIMIVPARWYAGGKGLHEFREAMLSDKRLATLVDFQEARDVFPNVEIKGGVCYFHWKKNHVGNVNVISNSALGKDCLVRSLNEFDVFVRLNKAIPILKKVLAKKHISFSSIVSSRKPFGLGTNFNEFKDVEFSEAIKIYTKNGRIGFLEKDKIPFGMKLIDCHKIFLSKAYGAGYGYPHQIINKPIIADPDSCCTETYLVIGPFDNETHTFNAENYLKSKFARFLIYLRKLTQDNPKDKFNFLPKMDFTLNWNDEKLNEFFNLSIDEQEIISKIVRKME